MKPKPPPKKTKKIHEWVSTFVKGMKITCRLCMNKPCNLWEAIKSFGAYKIQGDMINSSSIVYSLGLLSEFVWVIKPFVMHE